MDALEILLTVLLSVIMLYLLLSVTFLFFAGVMHLKHLRENLSMWQEILAWPAIGIAYLCDILTNIIMCPLLFKSLPRHLLFSDTLSYYANRYIGTRNSMRAIWWGKLLDNIDPSGRHI
jgi:hypothetical protein